MESSRKMKQLFLIAFVVIFGLSACGSDQVEDELVRMQIQSASVAPKADKTAEPDPKSHADKTAHKPEGCTKVEVNYDLKLLGKWASSLQDVNYNLKLLEGWALPIKYKDFRAKPRTVGKITKDICWFKFDPGTLSKVATGAIEVSGEFKVADIWELSSLAVARPDLRKFILASLGSGWSGTYDNVGFPYISGVDGRREFGLFFTGSRRGWRGHCRFAAVRTRLASGPVNPKTDEAETDPKPDPKPEGCIKAWVNYDIKPPEMNRRHGGYYSLSKVFREKPRATGSVLREICWFKFSGRPVVATVLERIEGSGTFLAADMWELSSLAVARRDLQRNFLLVALGSRYSRPDDNIEFPMMNSRNQLQLHFIDSKSKLDLGYGIRTLFLAVRIRK